MEAVIEFKEDNNQDYYQEVVALCNDYPSVKVTFISFQFSDLQAGEPVGVCNTPDITHNDTAISTTAWVNTKFQVVSALPASPNANVFYFIPE